MDKRLQEEVQLFRKYLLLGFHPHLVMGHLAQSFENIDFLRNKVVGELY